MRKHKKNIYDRKPTSTLFFGLFAYCLGAAVLLNVHLRGGAIASTNSFLICAVIFGTLNIPSEIMYFALRNKRKSVAENGAVQTVGRKEKLLFWVARIIPILFIIVSLGYALVKGL